ncbi:MAG: NifU family protein [Planctomycetes bacterium]|nr:NifU family protein [Planctomycetota bacterium]MCB9871093.1 NifU family protein [Planctomycetota bacterium]MCB9888269.1 NifU family protein [Planctomycetota bacterium]
MNVLSIQPTPNPSAFKFVVDATLQPTGSRYYNSAQEAATDPLAMALFAIPGVQTVYFAQDFATVTSADGANLQTLHEQVQQVLETHEGGAAPRPAMAAPELSTDDEALMQQINEILDDRVRPALAGDGGGLQILGLQEKVLTIRYQGACGSCPSSIAGTLHAIQNLLQMEVDEQLTVISQ